MGRGGGGLKGTRKRVSIRGGGSGGMPPRKILNASCQKGAENASKTVGHRMSNDTMYLMRNSSVTLPFISVNNRTCPCIASSRNLQDKTRQLY